MTVRSKIQIQRLSVRITVALLLGLNLLWACRDERKEKATSAAASAKSDAPAPIFYDVVSSYPHDVTSFTEGLLVHEGKLYESTGSPSDLPQARSLVGVVDMTTGQLEKKVELDRNKYFGEGMVFLNDKLFQLTYTTKVGFIYDAKTFKKVGEFTFPSKEGWGMTTDGTHLIMSDGTNTLTYLDPESLKPVKSIRVFDDQGPVVYLNELEYIKGFIYANVYTKDYLVKIEPASGKTVGKIDLTSLAYDAKAKNQSSLEMNGIAYDPAKGSVYITGKFWANIYEIKFNH